jgi:hypothetical protein
MELAYYLSIPPPPDHGIHPQELEQEEEEKKKAEAEAAALLANKATEAPGQ